MPWTRKLASPILAASSSKTRMNSAPIALRLASGSLRPFSRARKRSSPSTATSGTWNWSRNAAITCSPSFLRIIPWSTNTHVSWSPTAWCTSSAATRRVHAARERADDLAVADLGADRRDLLVDDVRRRSRCARSRRCPRGTSSGCAGRRACARPRGGTGSRTGRARRPRPPRPATRWSDASAVKPSGAAYTVSRCDIQHACAVRRARQQPAGLGHRQLRAAELPHLGALDAAAEREHERLHPVTDAEHGDAELQQLRIELRRARRVHRRRARR